MLGGGEEGDCSLKRRQTQALQTVFDNTFPFELEPWGETQGPLRSNHVHVPSNEGCMYRDTGASVESCTTNKESKQEAQRSNKQYSQYGQQ